jgi:hypothetical protein
MLSSGVPVLVVRDGNRAGFTKAAAVPGQFKPAICRRTKSRMSAEAKKKQRNILNPSRWQQELLKYVVMKKIVKKLKELFFGAGSKIQAIHEEPKKNEEVKNTTGELPEKKINTREFLKSIGAIDITKERLGQFSIMVTHQKVDHEVKPESGDETYDDTAETMIRNLRRRGRG